MQRVQALSTVVALTFLGLRIYLPTFFADKALVVFYKVFSHRYHFAFFKLITLHAN